MNLNGVAAAEVAATAGSAGRASLTNPDVGTALTGAATAFQNYQYHSAVQARAAASQAEDAAGNQFVRAANDLTSFVSEGATDKVAALVVGLQDSGEDMLTEGEIGKLKEYNMERERLDSMRSQQPGLMLDLAMRKLQNRFLAEHPQLKPEVFKLSNANISLIEKVEDRDHDAKLNQERKDALVKHEDELILARKGPDGLRESPEERTRTISQISQDVSQMSSTAQTLALLKDKEGISDIQRTQQQRQALQGSFGPMIRTLTLGVIKTLKDAPGGETEKIAAAQEALVQGKLRIANASGMTPAEVDSNAGGYFTSLQGTITDFATNKTSMEALQNRLRIQVDSAKEEVLTKVPAVKFVAALEGLGGQTFGRVMQDSPALQAVFSRVLTSRAMMGEDAEGWISTPKVVQDKLNAGDVAGAAEEGTKAARQNFAAFQSVANTPEWKNDPEFRTNVILPILASVGDRATDRDPKGETIRAQLPAMADPKFIEALPPTVPANVSGNLQLFNDRASNSLLSLMSNIKVGGVAEDRAATEQRFHLNETTMQMEVNTSGMAPDMTRKVQRALNDVNLGIKASAHLNRSTDYRQEWIDRGW